MALYPQLDTVIENAGQTIVLRKVTHGVSEYGSPTETFQDWVTKGSVANVSAEDDQFFQGLITSDSRKIYLRGEAKAQSGAVTKTVKEVGIAPQDGFLISGTEYRIVSVKDYQETNGFFVVLVRAVGAGG